MEINWESTDVRVQNRITGDRVREEKSSPGFCLHLCKNMSIKMCEIIGATDGLKRSSDLLF